MSIFGKADKTISITTNTIVKLILVAVIAFVSLQALGNITHQLRLIFISMFLAIGLNPAVSFIMRRIHSKSRLRATGIAYIIVVALLAGFLLLVVPPLVKQTSRFVSGVPNTLNNLKYQDSALSSAIRRYNLEDSVDDVIANYQERFKDNLSNVGAPIVNTAGRVGGLIISAITIFILTFMMLVEGPLWFDKIISLQPDGKKKKRKEIAQRMYKVITGFFYGQVIIAFIAATFAAIMLFILNSVFGTSVNPIALAGIVFIFGLLPLVGNILSASIVVLICLISSAPMALIMLGFFIVYQQIENATLQPYIQSKKNQLTPLTVFVAAILGAGLAGLLGALAAIPIAGCARILLEEYLSSHFPNYETFSNHNKVNQSSE